MHSWKVRGVEITACVWEAMACVQFLAHPQFTVKGLQGIRAPRISDYSVGKPSRAFDFDMVFFSAAFLLRKRKAAQRP
jgi:hypothetical protein